MAAAFMLHPQIPCWRMPPWDLRICYGCCIQASYLCSAMNQILLEICLWLNRMFLGRYVIDVHTLYVWHTCSVCVSMSCLLMPSVLHWPLRSNQVWYCLTSRSIFLFFVFLLLFIVYDTLCLLHLHWQIILFFKATKTYGYIHIYVWVHIYTHAYMCAFLNIFWHNIIIYVGS